MNQCRNCSSRDDWVSCWILPKLYVFLGYTYSKPIMEDPPPSTTSVDVRFLSTNVAQNISIYINANSNLQKHIRNLLHSLHLQHFSQATRPKGIFWVIKSITLTNPVYNCFPKLLLVHLRAMFLLSQRLFGNIIFQMAKRFLLCLRSVEICSTFFCAYAAFWLKHISVSTSRNKIGVGE